jgi:hypothetical protein
MRAAASAAAAAADSPAGAAGEVEHSAAAAASLSPEQEFDACLEHAVTCMMAEVRGSQQASWSGMAAGTACCGASRLTAAAGGEQHEHWLGGNVDRLMFVVIGVINSHLPGVMRHVFAQKGTQAAF